LIIVGFWIINSKLYQINFDFNNTLRKILMSMIIFHIFSHNLISTKNYNFYWNSLMLYKLINGKINKKDSLSKVSFWYYFTIPKQKKIIIKASIIRFFVFNIYTVSFFFIIIIILVIIELLLFISFSLNFNNNVIFILN